MCTRPTQFQEIGPRYPGFIADLPGVGKAIVCWLFFAMMSTTVAGPPNPYECARFPSPIFQHRSLFSTMAGSWRVGSWEKGDCTVNHGYRIIIVDKAGVLVSEFQLTENALADPVAFVSALKQSIEDVEEKDP